MDIKEIFSASWIQLNSSQILQFEKFLALFKERNSIMNLSAIRDDEWIVNKHFLDSVMLNEYITLNWKILDIWTWWWFPWIPLAITNPDSKFILLDSTRKKIDSVNHFCNELNLDNCKWIWGRAEEIIKNEYKSTFDFIVSRATAYLPEIINLSYPFLKKWWKMIFYKIYDEEEVSKWNIFASKLWMRKVEILNYAISSQERSFIIFQK